MIPTTPRKDVMTGSREQQFHVYLYVRIIGRLQRRDNLTRFVFEPDYWGDPGRPVLGLRFEEDREARHRANLRLPPWFSNLLLEGRLREWIARAGHTSIDREMDLLAQVGHDLPGAVRVLPASDPVPVDMSGGEASTPVPEDGPTSLWRFSLAGVGLKLSLLAQGDRLVIPAMGDGGDWILKLPDPGFPDLADNEWAMMRLAGAVGIEVPAVRLVRREQIEALPERVWAGTGDYAYAVRRFDRDPRRRPIHIEDLAQVRGFYPDWKYRGSFETVGALVYRQHDREALREFTRRLTFNLLIGNGDVHLKNWSLIYHDRRNPTLAPAYDLVATFVYRPDSEGPEPMALRFGGSKRFEAVHRSAFARLDERLGAKAELAAVAETVVARVREEWPRAAALLAGQPELCGKIERFMQARAAHLLR